LKEPKAREGFVEESQYKTLMSNAKEPWLRCFVGLGFNFGMRKSEILALKVGHVDLLENWLLVVDSKNGESRRIKLTMETSRLLAVCIRGKEKNDHVLTQHGSKVAQPRKDWYSLCVRSGLGKMLTKERPDGKTSAHYEGLQMHDLRRSAVKRLVDSGVREKIAMLITGHKSRSVFDRYHIGNDKDLEQAAKLLEPGQRGFVSETETDTKTDTTGFAHS
jgi:integrase